MVPHWFGEYVSGLCSQKYFHRFFVSGLTTAELVYVPLIVIVTITMYTVLPTGFPYVGCGSWHASADSVVAVVRGTLRRIVLYRVRLAANKTAGRDAWSAPSHRL